MIKTAQIKNISNKKSTLKFCMVTFPGFYSFFNLFLRKTLKLGADFLNCRIFLNQNAEPNWNQNRNLVFMHWPGRIGEYSKVQFAWKGIPNFVHFIDVFFLRIMDRQIICWGANKGYEQSCRLLRLHVISCAQAKLDKIHSIQACLIGHMNKAWTCLISGRAKLLFIFASPKVFKFGFPSFKKCSSCTHFLANWVQKTLIPSWAQAVHKQLGLVADLMKSWDLTKSPGWNLWYLIL